MAAVLAFVDVAILTVLFLSPLGNWRFVVHSLVGAQFIIPRLHDYRVLDFELWSIAFDF